MFKNSAKILFSIILMVGTLIAVSSTSWIGSWMGLEINLLAFIPIMNTTKNLMSTESSLKYFLVQALASAIFLISVILIMIKSTVNQQISPTDNLPMMSIMSSLLMKSGAAPFHFWFPAVMEGLTWINSFILMTWQKIAPLMILSYLSAPLMILSAITLSVLVGSLGGLNQVSLRKLMAFSSINHIGWMLAAMQASESLWMIYFFMYSFLSMNIIMMFFTFKVFHFSQLFSMFFSSKTMKFFLFMNMLSLGGLPPFLGFLPKWLVIQSLTMNNQITLMIFMTTLTLITLFYYLRLTFSAYMLNYYEPNWMMTMNVSQLNMFMLSIMSFLSIAGLSVVSLIFLII